MNIFGGRPGIAAGVLAVIAILAAAFCIISVSITLLILCVALVILCIVLCACGYIKPYRLFVNLLLIAVFCTSLLRGLDVFYSIVPDVIELCGEDRYLHGTVLERRSSDDYYSMFNVRVHSVDGIECDQKALLTCEYNSDLQRGYEFILRGAEIVFVGDLESANAESLFSDGIYLSVTSLAESDCAILTENNLSLTDRFDALNSYFCAKIRNDIKGEEGRLVAAMLLGDKSALTGRMYRDFSRSGLSHYLAVSGLHVSIITGIVSFFLLSLRLRRSIRNLLLTAFALGYLCLLGFPVSAVRSVIMLLTVFLAYSMGDVSDSINALGIAAVIILLISPTSVFDISFILSFCATLGIVCFMPLFNDVLNKMFTRKPKKEKEKKRSGWILILKKLISFIFGTLMSVAAALSLTLLPIAYLFGETSVLGFRSNIASALVGTPLLASSLLYLFIGDVPYLGDGVEFVISKSARYMLDLSAELSDEQDALLSLVSDEAKCIILVFAAIILIALVIKIKHKRLLLIIPAAYPVVIFAISVLVASMQPKTTELTFISSQGDEVILAQCGGESAIIDISDGSLMRLNLASSRAHEEGITEIDTFALTHYHTRHLSSVSRFIASEMVRRVLLPYPETETDAWIMLQLVNTVQEEGIACEIYKPDTELNLMANTTITFSEITRLERSNHPVLYFTFCDNGERITYLTASSWETPVDFKEKLAEFAENSDVLVLGAHGPVAKEAFELPINGNKEFVIFDESHLAIIPDVESLLAGISGDGADVYIGEGVYKRTLGSSRD